MPLRDGFFSTATQTSCCNRIQRSNRVRLLVVSTHDFPDTLSKEENEHSVAQVSRCTDTGTCAWTEDGTKPQLVGGLGEKVGGVSVLHVTVSVLVANPKHYFTLWPIQLYRVQYNTVQYQW